MKVCFCYTVPSTLQFAEATVVKLKDKGIDVVLVSSDNKALSKIASRLGVQYYAVDFCRGYDIISDFKAIFKLFRLFKIIKPDIVIGATPKAALLSMISSKLAGVKRRVYHIFGFPFETSKGIVKALLVSIERITAMCSTNVLPISQSIADVCIANRLTRSRKLCTDYLLTIGGVDMNRFNPLIVNDEELRQEYQIQKNDIVVGFVGRITRDKGIYDFIEVVKKINNCSVKYLIIGDNDARVPVEDDLLNYIDNYGNIIHVKYTDKIEKYYKLMNILLIPSYREGFGNANVEAQAMNVPVVCYNVTGCKDSVNDAVSGFLLPFQDINGLTSTVESLINNQEQRTKMGIDARQFVFDNFTADKVAANNLEFILKLFNV